MRQNAHRSIVARERGTPLVRYVATFCTGLRTCGMWKVKHLVFIAERDWLSAGATVIPSRTWRRRARDDFPSSRWEVYPGFPNGFQYVRAWTTPVASCIRRRAVSPQRSLRALAEETGGSASFFQDADKALDRLNRSTRSAYLLGYYPSRAAIWKASIGKFESPSLGLA